MFKKQRDSAVVAQLKKFFFSLFQLMFFTAGVLKGECRFGPTVVVGDWPHSEWRSRFLILGTTIVAEERIFVENWGKIYRLGACPQKEFFRKLDAGEDIHADPYYLESKKRLDADAFQAWLCLKLELWQNFKQDPGDFTPIAVRRSMRQFLVQDGAHRLSLRSLRGNESHILGIKLLEYRKKQ
jgi:hypothetical protein